MGAFGHAPADAGVIEMVVSTIRISENLVPANSSCRMPDPELVLEPVPPVLYMCVNYVLSNYCGVILAGISAVRRKRCKEQLQPQ